jgi:hypothetical protein
MIHAGSQHKPQEPTNHSTWSRFVFQATQSLAKGEYLFVAPWRNIHTPLYEGGHTPLYESILACPLEYPKLNTWTKANLGKFLITLLYEGLFLLYEGLFLFLLYEGLPVGLLIPSLRRSSYGIRKKKISCGPKYFYGIIPCYPYVGHHPSTG